MGVTAEDLTWKQRTGYLNSMNEQQKEAFEKFKSELMSSEYASILEKNADLDAFLLAYLRGTMKSKKKDRVFDVAEAKKKMIPSLEIRKKYSIDEMRINGKEPERFEEFYKLWPSFTYKDEKAKTIVSIERFGYLGNYINSKALPLEVWEECTLWVLQLNNVMRKELRESTGAEAPGSIQIIDLKGLGLGLLNRLSFVKLLTGVFQDHGPESVMEIHVINGPWVLPRLYNAVKPFLDPDTQNKIKIHKKVPYEMFRDRLDPAMLPKEWGGDRDIVPIYPGHTPEKYVKS
mmetsp:Transcript_10541/g.12100  ORF Transcript_10541/g.12100 Transcript_10541/m.12100 type:complete len:289 (-) Transcript_10541:516-1382(-)